MLFWYSTQKLIYTSLWNLKTFPLTGEETLIIMTKDFDAVCEFPFHSEEFGEGESSNNIAYSTFVLIVAGSPK